MAGGLSTPATGLVGSPLQSVHASHDPAQCFAALDLGTNNCRLLVAQRAPGGFRVVMQRTYAAIQACSEKIARYKPARMRCVATQACRAARNGTSFLKEITRKTGIRFEVISPNEEARLAVIGCADLFDPTGVGALVVDIGGGSTELSWAINRGAERRPKLEHWFSAPIGVVTLADQFPEHGDTRNWYAAMKQCAADHVAGFETPDVVRNHLITGKAHIVGTSGAVTSLAGVHLGLARYSRRLVDGLWISEDDTRAAIANLMARDKAGRAAEPCIGPDRADLVLAGAAILEAILDRWPSLRLRVADRGLREGLILTMLEPPRRRRRRRRAKS